MKKFTLESYGVRISIEAESGEVLERIKQILPIELPERYHLVEKKSVDHIFSLKKIEDEGIFSLEKNGENVINRIYDSDLSKYVGREIRITVAEFAENKVFLHAGVVGYKGRAIIIPASSFKGKTTLVSELIKKGALYYSDEYAVLDEDGMIHPFPKMLSVRGIVNEYTQTNFPVEKFGGKKGKKALPVGLILITEYEKGAKLNIEPLSPGQGLLEILNHTIPIRHKPRFTLEVLGKIVDRAIIVKTKRGEAGEFAENLLRFFETRVTP